ncbi:DUF2207 domain-containing protein [Nonomuraea gerenzanensis]|uniref:Uncharacterized protein n=1 Tax=Nonomuraea gerenzanensis TaxID=93944 RepID=A0A1M4E020_9ACTN|nr:hypothetical protein [Nonomuraea gerenzanensis]UBU14411.1 hypothetical protein LCN96_05145 [Nonomuraea gerenzanensis]SBO92125.1 hypothetical protein BN4615_P1639 [Nonomuraea gerenzanensis]
MDLVWPAAAWALWVALLAAAFKVSSRHHPGRGPERPAPAPVADLLRGMRAQEVFHTALFELAGRGWVSVEGDHLSLGAPREEPLPAYERWVVERVRHRMGDAPEAAVTDLMPPASELDRAFVPLVRAHAIELGLARRRWPSVLVPVLLAAGLVVPWYATVVAAGVSWPGIIATAVSFVAGIGLLMGGRGFLLTERGREVAAAGPAGPAQEWIFTGSGWLSGEIEPARPLPQRQEITGHVVKRWTDTEHYYIALHDGSSRKATAFEVEQGLYQDVLPGDCVRVLVRPRSGTVVRVLAHDRHW